LNATWRIIAELEKKQFSILQTCVTFFPRII